MTPRSGTMLESRRALAFALGMAALALAGCKQGVGDRCQVDSDCDDTLVCVIPSGASLAQGGSCQPIGTATDAGVDGSTDAAAPPDMAVPGSDAGEDMAAKPDQATVDTAMLPDLTPLDGTVDGSTTD